jgi:hypothetical protein
MLAVDPRRNPPGLGLSPFEVGAMITRMLTAS